MLTPGTALELTFPVTETLTAKPSAAGHWTFWLLPL